MATSIDGYLDDMSERERQQQRIQRGLTPHPVKVTLTGRGDLDATARFFSCGDDVSAPRLLHPGRFPHDAEPPMTLAETRQIGDVVLLRYLATDTGR